MIIKPELKSHAIETMYGSGQVQVTYVTDTLFDNLELTAIWSEEEYAYRFQVVKLSYRPAAIRKNLYAPWAKVEDRRFRVITLEVKFGTFCDLVRQALQAANMLKILIDCTPTNAVVSKPLNDGLILSTEGIFLKDWPSAPIFDRGPLSQKAAALAIFEMLEMEALLPAEQL